ncbi:26S proteasome complex subunit DSS1 [Stylophora pistillata]|uniref:26S proteasome complex subunit SEM1 n=1 Tax=Stylophora pistillata TaxID=50429 RepID=A0A2B4S649_STYPI|nr:26S proteasome complex subunit DSS1 [Stylophora pistillata]
METSVRYLLVAAGWEEKVIFTKRGIDDQKKEWTAVDEDQADIHVWEDNWDDDTVEDDFSNQLRAELEKNGHQVEQAEPMKT